MMMVSCTNKDKPLVLSWGRTPRLDSGVRVSQILGFPNISLISVSGPKWDPYRIRVRSNRVLRTWVPFRGAFLCLMGISRNYTLDEDTYPQFLREDGEAMDLISFIRTADPTKIRIGERQHDEDEPKLLDTTVGRTVPLLPEEKNDSAAGGQSASIQIVSKAAKIIAEDVVPLQPKHKKKRKTVVDVGEPSHPAKKLRDDHGTPGGPTVGGKSRSAVQHLFAEAVLNAKVRGEVIPTFPFVTSSVSATPERKEEDHTNSLAGANLRTIRASQRFVISSDSSHHSGANIAGAEVDPFARTSVPLITMTTTVTSTAGPATTAKENLVESSIFGDSSSSGADHTVNGFSGLTGSDFIVGGIRTIVSPDIDLQKYTCPNGVSPMVLA
ncbi:hypothetical protein Tco_0590288 [Tanacetum coccineum]